MKVVLALLVLCILPLTAYAQDLPPEENAEKEHTNMNSELARIYKAALAGEQQEGGAEPSSDTERVQVVLEMVSPDAAIPPNLGITVQTSYENLIQATVPVINLAAIASHENVKFVRTPAMAVPGQAEPGTAGTMPGTDKDLTDTSGIAEPSMAGASSTDTLTPYLFSIPAIAAVAGFFIWKSRVQKR